MKKILAKSRLACARYIQFRRTKRYFPKNAVVFDVGAHTGEYTSRYLALGAKFVVCVEPQTSSLAELHLKFDGNPRVAIVSQGLADKPGILTFHPYGNGTLSTASSDWMEGRFKHSCWEPPIEIPVTTLDALIERFGLPDFCKIDVEGFEWNVLMGLSQPIPLCNFEFVKEFLNEKTKPCLDRLAELGYTQFNATFNGSEKMVFSNWMDRRTLESSLETHPNDLLWGDVYAYWPKGDL